MVVALLDVDDGEVGVGGEGIGGVGLLAVVVGDVLGAALLVGAQDHTHVGGEGQAQVPDGLHGQQGAHHGALVIADAPAVEHAVLFHTGVGIGGPAGALPHHVQVAQDVEPGLLVVEVGQTHVMVVVGGGEAQLGAELQCLVQGGGGAGAEGLAGLSLPLHALHGHQPGDGGHQLPLPGRVAPIGFDLFLIHR